jgi:predicted ribonuclease YlaK
MLRELDEFKGDPRKERSRRRQRAVKVLQVLESTAEAAATGTPAPLRSGVEVLVLDHEPSPDVTTLDPRLADDRLIAAALDFREHLPNERVILVSDDRGPRFKARRYGLERRDLPAGQRRLLAEAQIGRGGVTTAP